MSSVPLTYGGIRMVGGIILTEVLACFVADNKLCAQTEDLPYPLSGCQARAEGMDQSPPLGWHVSS